MPTPVNVFPPLLGGSSAVGGTLTTTDGDWTPPTNLVTNGDFEVDTSGWTNNGLTSLTRITTDQKFGSASMRLVGSGTGKYASFGPMAVTAGTSYRVSLWLKKIAGTAGDIQLWYYNASFGFLSSNTLNLNAATDWTQFTLTQTMPTNTAYLYIIVASTGESGAFEYHVDGVIAQQNSFTNTYAYQWQRDNSGNLSFNDITGATSSSYVVVAGDQQCNLRCKVTATNAGSSASAFTSSILIVLALGNLLQDFPLVTVEVGFASNPGTAQGSITWTDVSSYCRGLSISRGRRHELGSFEAGTATITLKNRDRRFEPQYTSSPYYPNVVPLRPVRISATYGGTTYRLFSGFIEEWPPSYNGPSDSDVVITAVDAFEPLNQVAVSGSYPQELTSARVARVLDAASWPSADRVIGTGSSSVQSATVSEENALQHIGNVTSTELGRFFVNGAGQVVFQNRTGRFVSPYNTSQATFGDSAAEVPYVNLGVSYTKDEIRNDIVVTRNGGTAQEATDSTSTTSYLKRTYSVSPLLVSDAESLSMANYLLSVYKQPQLRIDSLELQPRLSPSVLWPQALGREIGDHITVKRRPPGGAGTNQTDHYIEGIAHTVTKGTRGWSWSTSFFTSPVTQAQAWVLNSSALNTGTVLVY